MTFTHTHKIFIIFLFQQPATQAGMTGSCLMSLKMINDL